MKNFSSKPGANSAINRAAVVLDFVKFDAKITDKNLYKLCKQYGAKALLWRRRFAGLLPEVEKRRLFEKKGFISIFVFAAKLAGISKEHVRRVLNVAKKFETMPILKSMLENGEVSINKLARITSVATSENQEFWATQARLLSKSALETLVRDKKYLKNQLEYGLRNSDGQIFKNGKEKSEHGLESAGRQISEIARENIQGCDAAADFELQKVEPKAGSGSTDFQNQNGLFEPKNDAKSVPGHRLNDELNLSPSVKQKLLNLQRKGIDINELLKEFLEKRDEEIAQEKEKLAAEIKPTNSRYRSVAIEEIIKKEFGTKCSIDWCMREAVEIHHLQRFSLSQKHDPRYLAPFCEEHHAIAHSIDVKFHEVRAQSLYPEQKPEH